MSTNYVVADAQSNKGKRYDGGIKRAAFLTRRPTHIARAGALRSLCGVMVLWPPRQAGPEDATCRRCRSLYRKENTG